ncbi:DUF2946 domain-containing protein [Erwinia sp. Leaf53]|uniref:DUF2946 domain-containing protein n=2 Tax=unclassified Erwinia TaxID=2622719 RepID=UPI00092E8DA7|nr:DUF2946 domain-containing protein [Erwinia sp. Leaf53]
MLLSYRLTHSRISAFIALLAIGLLFIAPDISKILEQQRMSAWGGMRMGMHEMTMPQAGISATGESELVSGHSAITGERSSHHSTGSATPDNAAAAEGHPSGHRHHSETPGQHGAEPAHQGHTTSATETRAGTGADSTHPHPRGMDEFSCGYCELLAHLPILVWIFIPLLWLILLTSRLPPPLALPPYPQCWFPGTSQPRAPPHA